MKRYISSNLVLPALLCVFLLCSPGLAGILWVPDNYNTIQAAINDANLAGDTVRVRDGVWTGAGNFNIDTLGKAVIVESNDGPANCIIDCNEQGRAFIVKTGEGLNTIIRGFTIINGVAKDPAWPRDPNLPFSMDSNGYGGAIYCEGTSPQISDCVITDNAADYGGGAIFCNAGSDPCIGHCLIAYNWCGTGVYDINQLGGGIYCRQSNLTIKDCNVTKNEADGAGGGIASQNSDVNIVNIIECNIIDNLCIADAPGADDVNQFGGGIYSEDGNLFVANCNIRGNLANDSGGAIAVLGGTSADEVNIIGCEILDNTCYASGGGIFIQGSRSAVVKNCVIAYNRGYWSGAISITDSNTNPVDINNCTIADNKVPWQCAPWPLPEALVGGIEAWGGGLAAITNSIIWGNKALQLKPNDINIIISISYSDVQYVREANGCAAEDSTHVEPGENNINYDPCFANRIRRDYHLMTSYLNGRYNPSTGLFDQTDPCTSPCINAGYPYADYSREPDPCNGGRINMGAYGNTEQASKSDIKRPVFGHSLSVDMATFASLGAVWQQEVQPRNPVDADNNLFVDEGDLAVLAQFWLWDAGE